MRVTLCGVRGSTPAPGRDYLRYGGYTSCVAIARDGQKPSLILDAGTGLHNVTPLLDGAPFHGSVLLGHLHWDHTHGMPFFGAGGAAGSRVEVYIPEQGDSAEAVLERCFSPPHFPIVPSQLGAGWSFDGLEEGVHQIEGFTVLAREIPHKGGRTFGFRVEGDGGSLAYLSDHSPTSIGPGPDGLGERHEAIMELSSGVDLLIHDAQHVAAEFPGVAYLGHASVEYCLAAARKAGATTVVLFHHAPTRTDDQLDAIGSTAREIAGEGLRVHVAAEGMVFDLPDHLPEGRQS